MIVSPKTIFRAGLRRARAAIWLGRDAWECRVDVRRRPGLLFGTAEDALAKLRSYAQMGIGHINIMFQPFGSERSQIAALSGIAAKLA